MLLALLLISSPLYAAMSENAVTVQLKGPKGEVVGTAMITAQDKDKGVKIKLEISKLPAGEKAIHIHEKGVCTGPKFDSAGSHLAGSGKAHGEVPDGPHAGDMKNLNIKGNGTTSVEIINTHVTLSQLRKDAGTSLVIHEKPDDYKTQPSGNAGARIACGEIK